MLETPSIRLVRAQAVKIQRCGQSAGKAAQAEPSETNTLGPLHRGEDRVRTAWRHAELGRNDLAPDVIFGCNRPYLDEDGLTVTVTPTIDDKNVWQSAQPIRRTLQSQTIALSGKFAEHNTHTVPRAFGGGTLSALASPGGTYAFVDPVATGLEEFAVCADVTDGSDRIRYIFGRVNQTETTEVQYNRQNLAVLPFSFGVLAPSAGGSPGTAYVINT